jgi:hypothetical protein
MARYSSGVKSDLFGRVDIGYPFEYVGTVKSKKPVNQGIDQLRRYEILFINSRAGWRIIVLTLLVAILGIILK